MNRLTEYHAGVPVIKDKTKMKEAMEKLAAYEDAKEQGLLLELPCNIVTCRKLYFASEYDSEIYELRADEITIGKTMISNKLIYIIDSFNFFFEDFGKIVFKTKAEAEKALAEMEK